MPGADTRIRVSVNIQMERFTTTQGEAWSKLSWRRRLAWRLRMVAERLDNKPSVAFHGSLPNKTSMADFWDAATFGVTAAASYLADLSRDRQVDGEPHV